MDIYLHDPLALLLIFLLALLAAVLVLFALLLLLRMAGMLWAYHAQKREATLTPLLLAALMKPSDAQSLVRAVKGTDRLIVRDMILRLALDLKGDEVETLAGLYRELGLLRRDVTALRARSWTRRAAAAARLGTLRSLKVLPLLRAAVSDPVMGVRLTAVRAVGETADHEALTALVPLLGDSSPGVARAAVEVLTLRGREVVEEILTFLRSATTSSPRQAAVDVLGFMRAPQAADALFALVEDPDPTLRIKVVKAVAAIGDPRFKSLLENLLEDPRWEIRCHAAKGLSLLGSSDSVARLRCALEDSYWWVRFNAAVALAELGVAGRIALQKEMAEGRPLARTIARYLLDRLEMTQVAP
jgi:HEAT repeat protein